VSSYVLLILSWCSSGASSGETKIGDPIAFTDEDVVAGMRQGAVSTLCAGDSVTFKVRVEC
jgi:hypothetical protein